MKLVPDISTNHLWDFSEPSPWLMLQQCSFGIEHSLCRLPSDSLRNSLRKHVLPNSLRHALISLTGKETRGRKKRKEQSLDCCVWDKMLTAWCLWRGESVERGHLPELDTSAQNESAMRTQCTALVTDGIMQICVIMFNKLAQAFYLFTGWTHIHIHAF